MLSLHQWVHSPFDTTLSQGPIYYYLPIDVYDATVSFAKSRPLCANTLAKFQIPALTYVVYQISGTTILPSMTQQAARQLHMIKLSGRPIT